jgi:hypothetical protein
MDVEKNPTGEPETKHIKLVNGERRSISIYDFLGYKFQRSYPMMVNKKAIVYSCANRTIGELLWEFVTEGDKSGALGKPGNAKSGGTVRVDRNTVHSCLVDTKVSKDYPRVAITSHIRQALEKEGIVIKEKWPFFSGEVKVNVSHIALFISGRKPISEDMEASHRCHDSLACVLASNDDKETHLVWEDSSTNQARKNCGRVIKCEDCSKQINVCKCGQFHDPPCFSKITMSSQ